MATQIKPRRKTVSTNIIIALIAAVSGIVIAVVGLFPKFEFRAPVPEISDSGRVLGSLTDRAGSPISNITISVQGGAETLTDMDGKFTLNNVPPGNQTLVVRAKSERGSLTRNIWVEEDKTTNTKVVYDAITSSLGILSITSPVDGGALEVRTDGKRHRATVSGRCDGLSQMLRSFDVWVLLISEKDSRLWVQRPAALVDRNANTWSATITLGDEAHPPVTGSRWSLVAVAASADSGLGQIPNTPSLSQLPPHISSNVVMVQVSIVKEPEV
jgi:hypothetical protein